MFLLSAGKGSGKQDKTRNSIIEIQTLEMVIRLSRANKRQQTSLRRIDKSYGWSQLDPSHKSTELLDPVGRGPICLGLEQPLLQKGWNMGGRRVSLKNFSTECA